jgi:transcriptional regulator with AAA-type ATPase domain
MIQAKSDQDRFTAERVGSSRTLHANVRIISASNANLHDEVSAGRPEQSVKAAQPVTVMSLQ